jgi:small subunit ribosomal protein S21
MLIVNVEGNIEKALKKLKRKVSQTKQVKELREREKFTKTSVKKRMQKIKATYLQHLRDAENND